MTSGIPLSDQEQLYVLKWANKKTWGAIANDIQQMFGTKRKDKVLSLWYRRHIKTVKPIQVLVPEEMLKQISEEDNAVLSFLFSATVSNYLLAKSI